MARAITVGWMLALTLGAACGKSTTREQGGATTGTSAGSPGSGSAVQPPPPLGPAPTATWSTISNTNLHLEGAGLPRTAEVRPSIRDGQLELVVVDLPNGTVIASEGREHVVDHKPGMIEKLVVPVDARIGDEPWTTWQGKRVITVDWKIAFTVTVPGHAPVTVETRPLSVAGDLATLFTELATTRGWPGETAAPEGPAPAAAALVIRNFHAIGTAARTRDVRMIALGKQIENDKTRRCTGYVGAKDFTATSYDVELEILDRFTRKVLATRRFAGKPACPSMVASGPDHDPSHSEGPDTKAMKQWVSGQLGPLARGLGK